MMTRVGALSLGFMWSCPWRVEWKSRHEYWYRSQLGPFYIMHQRQWFHPRTVPEAIAAIERINSAMVRDVSGQVFRSED